MSDLSRFGKKVTKTIDRFLDKQIGIDDPSIRAGVIIGAGAFAGYYGGAALGGYIGASASAGGAVGVGASTATIAGVSFGTAGALTGAALAAKSIAQGGMTPAQVTGAVSGVKPPSSFGGDVLASQERLRKRLALQMSTSKTNVTLGGIRGISSTVRPTLMTL